jgi:hypothetical protein
MPQGIYKRIKRWKLSKETKEKIRQAKIGPKHPRWGGDNIGYSGIHSWARRWKPPSTTCTTCNTNHKTLDLANISQNYKRDLEDWEWLCRRCHMLKDGRLGDFAHQARAQKKSGQHNTNWRGGLPKCSVCKKTLSDRRCKTCLKHREV